MDKGKQSNVIREFGLTSWAVDNRTTVFLMTFIIVLAGIAGYIFMPKEAFPEVKLPTIFISTPYPGNSPENIEKLIARPLEKEINGISGVKKISSNSVQDYSVVIVEFETEVEVEEALQDVKDALDKAKKDLPTDLDTDPVANEVNMGEAPIMNINLFGDHSAEEIKEYAELIKEKVEDLLQISRVELKGVDDKEVTVNIDIHRLTSLQLSFNDVVNAIRGRNVSMSAGTFKNKGQEISIMVNGEFDDVNDIESLVVKHEKGNIVYLKNILASPILLQAKEKESYARFNGDNVVMLDIIKGSGENLLLASDNIEKILKEAKDTRLIPKDIDIEITLDMSDQTRDQVSNLLNSIISGVILVVGILLFFLGTRNSLFVGVAIPVSMLMSFMLLNMMGISINMMVLFGLIMALGMLVDNGIVVVENVYRLMEEGYSPFRAAKEGVGEVAWPIISSTATTLAAFIPLAFWPGIMGEFMKYLPITLIIVLGSSLFVALVINPALTAVFMKVGAEDKLNPKKIHRWSLILGVIGLLLVITAWGKSGGLVATGNLLLAFVILLLLNLHLLTPAANSFQNKTLPRLENAYKRLLDFSLKGLTPIAFFSGTIALLIFSIILLGSAGLDVLFFPDNEPRYVNVFIDAPLGTEIEETNKITLNIEKQVREITKEYDDIINSTIAQVGRGTADPGDPFAGGGNSVTPHKARVTVEFVESKLRNGTNSQDVMNKIRKEIDFTTYPDVVFTIEKDRSGPPAGKPVNIEVTGEHYDILIQEVEKILAKIRISKIEGIEELKSDLELGKPEKILKINNAKAEQLGVSTSNIAQTIRTALFGAEASKYKDGEDDYPIQVRIDKAQRNDINTLMNLNVTFRSQSSGKIKQIPISSIAHIESSSSFGSIKRKNLDRVVTIYSNVLDGYNATAINEQLKILLEEHELPDGYSFKFTGEQEEQAENMNFLITALMMAVFMILLIIVAQFNKMSAPLIIMMSVLFSTIGVFLGLVIFDLDFIVIMTMIGIISLAGIVVNNAIVLIDYIILTLERTMKEKGVEKITKEELVAVIVESGKTRLRPVLLTAITTVLGLAPLAIGLNIDFFKLFMEYNADIYIGGDNALFWRPMSLTIIFGITFSTFLTLVIVPVMYLGIERLKYHVFKKKSITTN